MMFYMNSKVFEKDFLNVEKDQDILDAQYVLISTRVRVGDPDKWDNILNAKNALFPDPEVACALDDETFRERYMVQLENNKILIAYIIKGVIEENYNVIFICTVKESKIKYLDYLAEFILTEFGYPVYDYKKYSNFCTEDIEIDTKTTLNYCKRIIKEAEGKQLDNISNDEIHKDIKKLSKKALKETLKKKGLYRKGMDKYQMRELLEFDLL